MNTTYLHVATPLTPEQAIAIYERCDRLAKGNSDDRNRYLMTLMMVMQAGMSPFVALDMFERLP